MKPKFLLSIVLTLMALIVGCQSSVYAGTPTTIKYGDKVYGIICTVNGVNKFTCPTNILQIINGAKPGCKMATENHPNSPPPNRISIHFKKAFSGRLEEKTINSITACRVYNSSK